MNKIEFPFTRPELLCKVGFQEAYDALPEPYKNDSCLTFSIHGGTLCAEYDLGGSYYWSRSSFSWKDQTEIEPEG